MARYRQALETDGNTERRRLTSWLPRVVIMHLPNEILEMILGDLMEHCRPLGSPAPYYVCNLKDCPAYLARPMRDKCCNIQNIRLTCRLFRDLGARFLIPRLSVGVSRTSLHRLDAVSSHPLISQGVQEVRISLAMYDHLLATDYNLFRSFHHSKLLQHINLYEDHMQMSEALGEEYYGYDGYDPVTLGEARCIARKWSRGDNRDGQRILRRGFRKYRRRYNDQEELLEQGAFHQKLPIALSSMPKARHLWIDDHEIKKGWVREESLLDKMLASDGTLLKYLSGPGPLQRAPKPTLQQFIPSLLTKLPDAGIHIKSLWIHLTQLQPEAEDLLWDISNLPTAELDTKLKLSMTDLRSLKFQQVPPKDEDFPEPGFPDLSATSLAKCFSTLIQGDRIEELSIDTGLSLNRVQIPPSVQITSSLGPFLGNQKWSQLKQVQLTGIPLGPSEIVRIIEATQKGGNSIHQATRGHSIHQTTCQLKDVYLLDGTWADLLDAMRTASGGSTATSLLMPSGAECHSMTIEERDQIFKRVHRVCRRPARFPHNSSNSSDPSRAERYIWGQDAQNPLRKETAESSGTDFADEGGE